MILGFTECVIRKRKYTVLANIGSMTMSIGSAFCDFTDVLAQNKKNQMKTQAFQMNSDRRSNGLKNRNISTGTFAQLANTVTQQQLQFSNNTLISAPSDSIFQNMETPSDHRRLDRSVSEPGDRTNVNQQQPQRQNVSSGRYKTELCRPFEESGQCKYGDKCQFAHGAHELRTLARHPKYKTELCRTFHTTSICKYGTRCHFIHNEDQLKLNILVNNNRQANNIRPPITAHQQPAVQQQSPTPVHPAQRPKTISSYCDNRGSFDSAFDSPASSFNSDRPSLSPSLVDDVFSNSNMFSTAVPRSIQGSSTNSSTSSSPVFNYSAPEFAAFANLIVPVNNVRTQQQRYSEPSDNEMDQLQHNFDSILNLNHRNNNQSVFGDLEVLCAPPSPPESVSGDSIGSTSSLGSAGYCPLEIGKSLGLFNNRVWHNEN